MGMEAKNKNRFKSLYRWIEIFNLAHTHAVQHVNEWQSNLLKNIFVADPSPHIFIFGFPSAPPSGIQME